eukprot:2180949-Amphidinium_carterae.1
MSYIVEDEAYGMICRMYRSRISGIQYFVDGDTHQSPSALGVNLFGSLQSPAIGGDQSQLPLTFADRFVNGGVLLAYGVTSGHVYDVGSATKYLGVTSITWDAACIALLALHDALYRKGVYLEGIGNRNELAFQEVIESTSKVEMQGVTGSLRFLAPSDSTTIPEIP